MSFAKRMIFAEMEFDNMSECIENMELWDERRNGLLKNESKAPIVRIQFKYPCRYLVFDTIHMKKLIRLWIQGEKNKLNPDTNAFKNLIIEAFAEEGITF